jgi:hypothetical protein
LLCAHDVLPSEFLKGRRIASDVDRRQFRKTG